MSDAEVKVKVSADGATQAAAGVDKLTASLEKQRKTQEMIAKTRDQIQRQNVIDALKKEAAAVNGLTDALDKHQRSARGAANSLGEFGNNTQQLRAKLSPAAALIGNLSNSFSVLIPEAGGAAKALQVAGLAGSQMLGVLGGGPGILIGGLVAGVGALAAIMASSKKEADDLAKSTEANAKAMGTYLDQIGKLRGEVSAARQQASGEKDLRNKLLGNQGSVEEYETEIATQQKRLSNPYYRDRSLKLGSSEFAKRNREAEAIGHDIVMYSVALEKAKQQAASAAQQEAQKRSAALDFEASGTPDNPKGPGKGMEFQDVRSRIDKLREMENESQDKIAEYARQQRQNSYDERMLQLKDEVAASNKAIDEKYAYEADQRAKDAVAIAAHQQKLHADRKMYQDLAVQGEQIIASTAIKSFQMIAKGQKAEVGAILEGLGDQIVAMGTGYIFKGIAESILLNPQGPALIGVGTAAVGFGVGLGAIGARGPGGSTAAGTGSAGSNANPFGSNPYSNPQSPVNQQDKGPTIININMPTVVSPSPEDAIRMRQAFDAGEAVYGSEAVPRFAKR
jgi:hypothetical protein